jgi:uncharacterized protein
MTVIKKHKPGEFCWTDLGTKDVAGAKKFYQGIFGWKAMDIPVGNGFTYSMMRIRGKDVCAVYSMTDEQRKAKTPQFWLPYITVKSVARTVTKAKAAGGKVVSAPMKVMDKGAMAILQDPTGAVFAIWQPGTHPGAGLEDVPGTVTWHDLNTRNTKAAGKFYTTVFGWKLAEQDFSGNNYYLFRLKNEAVCGMWPMPLKKLATCWLTHWKVANCATTVAKAKRLGGRVLMGTTRVPGMGRFAVLTDPKGAAFGIIGK